LTFNRLLNLFSKKNMLKNTFALALLLGFGLNNQSLALKPQSQSKLKKEDATNGMKIVAVVGDQPITNYDVDRRIVFIRVSSGQPELKVSRKQVTQMLVDEKIHLIALKRYKIEISDEDVKEAMKGMAKANKMTVDGLIKALEAQGVKEKEIIDRFRAQIGWGELVRGAYESQAKENEEEVNNRLKQIGYDNQNTTQYELLEIVINVKDKKQEAAAKHSCESVYENLKNGIPFQVLVQQFSESTTALQGGLLGFVTSEEMEKNVEEAVSKLKIGEYTKPIRTNKSYSIFLLKDKKNPGQGAMGQTKVSFKQVQIPYNQEMSEYEAIILDNNLKDLTLTGIENPGVFEKKAQGFGYKVEERTDVQLASLPLPLQSCFNDTPIVSCVKTPENQYLIPLSTDTLGLFFVYKRQSPKFVLPTKAEATEMLRQEKLKGMAEVMLSKIRSQVNVQIIGN